MLSVMFPMAGGLCDGDIWAWIYNRIGSTCGDWGVIYLFVVCALIVLVGGLGIWLSEDAGIWPKVWHGIVAGVMWLTVGLSVVAYRDVRANPPADGVEILPRGL